MSLQSFRVHFTKFPSFDFSKCCSSPTFYQISTTRYDKSSILKTSWHIECFLTQQHMKRKGQGLYLSFHPTAVNLHDALITNIEECRVLLFFAINQILKKICHFKILTCEPMGQSELIWTQSYIENGLSWNEMDQNLGTIVRDELAVIWRTRTLLCVGRI